MQLIGSTLGQYRVTEQIGLGGMATVYKAYQPSLDRFVAIKVLSALHAKTPGFKERFFREARAVAQLSHPNILPVYDLGVENDICFLVMKCVSGSSMRDIIGEPMALSRVCRFIDQIAAALDHAHDRGIIHRDIKSHNLLLEGDWVFLTDFGIAKIMEASTVLTNAGELMGTPCYMSPEQASGKPVDHRTDIYSLGIVLYEMITGTVPFKGETPYGVIYKHIHDPLPLPRNHRPDLPDAVERVILRALAKDPKHRYDHAGQLAEALREAVASVMRDAAAEPALASSRPGEDASTFPVPPHAFPETDPTVAPHASTLKRGRRAWLLSVAGVLLTLAGIVWTLVHIGSIVPPGGSPSEQALHPSPPATPSLASLRIESTPPSAAIEVDGVRVGTTPGRIELPPGDHQVRLEIPGHQPWTGQVRLERDHEYPMSVDLKPVVAAASLRIDSTPAGAEVLVDGARTGATPVESELPLGSHSIRLSLAGFRDFERTLHLDEPKAYQVIVDLIQADLPPQAPSLPAAEPVPEPPEADFIKGRQLLEARSYRQAFDRLMKAAAQGHVESQNEVGYMLMHGLGVKKNLKDAVAWFRKGASQGHSGSQNNLGILYLKGGPGIGQDDREALNWFRMAAEQGDPDGEFYLANMYRYGRGCKPDADLALEWYRKAAGQGHEGAAKALKALSK